MHEDDRYRADAGFPRRLEVGGDGGKVGCHLDGAVGADALGHLDCVLEQHRRLDDPPGEDVGPRLVADPQGIAEALCDEKEDPIALALEKGIGGDGGAHLHRGDIRGRDPFAGLQTHQAANAGDGRLAEFGTILGEKLGRGDPACRIARDDICERAASIYPEVPSARDRCLCHVIVPRAVDLLARRGSVGDMSPLGINAMRR